MLLLLLQPPSPVPSRPPGMAVFDTMRHIRPDVSTVCGKPHGPSFGGAE